MLEFNNEAQNEWFDTENELVEYYNKNVKPLKDHGFLILADNSLPLLLHEHRGWTSLSEQERDELSRKNYGRFLKKWRERTDLLIVNSN